MYGLAIVRTVRRLPDRRIVEYWNFTLRACASARPIVLLEDMTSWLAVLVRAT